MYTTDLIGFPPGTYWMEVTGTVGAKSTTTQVPITLVNPCEIADLSLLTSPFVDETYYLRDPAEF